MLTKVLLTFIATIILYYTYKLLFGKCNRFNVCRIILLTMSVFAFVFPFISIKISGQMPEYFFIMDNVEILSNNEINLEADNVKNNSLSFLQIISAIYVVGVIFSFMKMFFNIYKVNKIKQGKKFEIIDNVKIIHTNENHIPFSFFNNIFIGTSSLVTELVEVTDDILPSTGSGIVNPLILKHEMSHVKNHHSLDVILMEIMISFQWFNPFIYKMKKELQNVHEYIADNEAVENETDKSNYMMLLLQQCTADNFNTVANNFSFLLTKKRISMITQKQKTKRMVMRLLLTLPVFAMLILLNTQCDNPKSNDEGNVSKEQVPVEKSEGQGQLSGTVVDRATGKPISTVTVVLENNGTEVASDRTGTDGRYEMTSIPAGTYELKATLGGYTSTTMKGIVVAAGKFAFMDIYMNQDGDTIYNVAETMPQFPGGPNALMKYLSENTKYPESAKANKIEGRVFVSFVIEKDGSITNAEVMRGIDKECDAEAVRVVSSMPKWQAGTQNGEAVRCRFTVPFIFKLNENEK